MRFISFLSACTALIACTVGSTGANAGTTCSVNSPAHRVALVELYTSEGCSSCPPADHWLSALDHARSANTVVPLALHVDYWDSLGWKDRFAQATFTARQRQLSDEGHQHVVYTPEVFIDGREMRDWSDDARFVATIQQLNAEASPVDIHVETHPTQAGRMTFDVSFQSSAKPADNLLAYAVVYENRLDSAVKAGENAGVTLHHDRVVRQWIGPVALANGHAAIAGDSLGGSAQSGVVAFAEDRKTGEVLQVADLLPCTN
ncbi:DUF1223 domain-containing protein [Paraburkholderia metrosideri]|uniref:DUF1223 domain-containing protein n=1 Tax=Paraburkholderia metrosideri TaxID=580937 RepID=A0ABN7I654_9BURK|nr:DUF1223 domain-containing protein [Paraburkholderia metrosideri]CAD6554335.1 hypothetical protein LMG28140_05479 [Paraburkholderia metrosideri]